MGNEGGRSFKRGRAEAETPSGCISAFFHLFDFHPFHFSSSLQQHQPQLPPSHSIPKGTEAPRNSLESEDIINGTMLGSFSKEEDLKIPKKNKLFIKTSTGGIMSSNGNNDLSPGTKTPTLVARLMGLDLLPDAQSPSFSSCSPSSSSTTTTTTSSSCLSSATKSHVVHHHHLRPLQHNSNNVVVITKHRHSMDDRIAASRFLPETHRISSARRSDVEQRHRLSLQINNKENMGVVGVREDDYLLELPRFSFSKLKFEENHQSGVSSNNRSPRHYAKQIVKQMRESVMSSRKFGNDVTNAVKNNSRERKKKEEEAGGGEFVVVGQFMRNKKSPRKMPTCSSSSDELSSPGKVSNNNNPSCSPRLRFMDPKNNKQQSTVTAAAAAAARKDQISPQTLKFDNVSSSILEEEEEEEQAQFHEKKQKSSSSSVPKCKKAANEKFSSRLKKPAIRNNKQDEAFVRPLSSSSSNMKSATSKSKRSSSNHPLLINLLNLNSNNNNNLPAAVNTKTQVCEWDAREGAKYCSSSQLSSGSSQTYNNNTKKATTWSSSSPCILLSTTATGESNVDESDNKRKTSVSMFLNNKNNDGPEFEYVSSILSRTGFSVNKEDATTTTKNTVSSVSFFHQWLSPPTQQPPLSPSIFDHLEQHFQNQKQDGNLRPKFDVGLRCNRRLLFDLVNETLVDVVVGPCYDEQVWERIGRLQSNQKCEVLEDIDALVEMEEDDMGKKMKMRSAAGAMVAEIEGDIMDTLLHETVRIVTECCYWWRWYGKDHDDAV